MLRLREIGEWLRTVFDNFTMVGMWDVEKEGIKG